MTGINKVAILGASGNFGTPITSALHDAGFAVTAVTRPDSNSTATIPAGIPVIRADYADVDALAQAFAGQHAVVCVVGPGAIKASKGMVDAAKRAGVRRYIINDFGWGLNDRSEPELKSIGAARRVAWDCAAEYARGDEGKEDGFTWTGITIGNPIDWALPKFPRMGFNISERRATIYDEGTEEFTGTTLEGIGQAVVGVLQHPIETANRFVKVRSIQTSQNALLAAFQCATVEAESETGTRTGNEAGGEGEGEGERGGEMHRKSEWEIEHSTSQQTLADGRAKHAQGAAGWLLDFVVFQLFAPGEARSVVAPSRDESDSPLLRVREETVDEVVRKALLGRRWAA
ncbi:NmrA-like family protein [Nemania sp. FL0916]|nr:NmrA-like family protein [Nemania sp. FL0916]